MNAPLACRPGVLLSVLSLAALLLAAGCDTGRNAGSTKSTARDQAGGGNVVAGKAKGDRETAAPPAREKGFPPSPDAEYRRQWLIEGRDPAKLLEKLGMADYLYPQAGDPASRYIRLDPLGEEIFTRTEERAVTTPAAERSIDAIVDGAARRYGIPAARIKAVIRAESAFRANAVSPAGAQGLMQLMPKTAKWLGVTDPFDPADNVDGGTRYLRMLHSRFRDWDLAHAAYNAGPGNVRKYGNRIPPFRETRDYVVRINRYFEHYRKTGA